MRIPSAKMLARPTAAAKPRPSTVLEKYREAIKELTVQHKAVGIKVFGSVARGEDRPGSDLDLLVLCRPDASLFDLAGLSQDIEDLTGVAVDVISENGLRDGHDEIRAQALPL
jgi:predicted nucleotidyltransferase